MAGYVEYSANNSGGHWWLADEDWKALESAGWKVAWATLEPLYTAEGDYVRGDDGLPVYVPLGEGGSGWPSFAKDGRYMGALAKSAYRVGLSLREAGSEFDRVTSQRSTDAGCACCGQPHNFTEYDADGRYVASGPETSFRAEWV